MCVHQITLYRQDRQPWGFRLHGGADFGTPLLIQLVKADSLSEAAGLQAGDILLSVSGQDVQLCRHKEAQDAIVRAGNKVNITIQRSGGMQQQQQQQTVNPGSGTPTKGLMGGMGKQSGPAGPGADKWGHLLEANTAGQADSAEEFTRQFMSQLTGESASNLPPPLLNGTVVNGGSNQHPANDVSYTTPQYERIVTPTKQVASGQPDKVKTTRAMGQYNSPQAMYSEDNIQEILDQQAEVLSNGVKGINFNQYNRKADPKIVQNSEVLKLLREQEAGVEMRGVGGGGHHRDYTRGSRVKSASPAPNYAHTPNTNSLPREKKIVQKITVRRTESPAPPSPALSPAPAKPTNTQNIQPARPSSSQGRCVTETDLGPHDSSSNRPKKAKDDKSCSVSGILSSYLTNIRTGVEETEPPWCPTCRSTVDRGPFITAMGKTWCPSHFLCSMEQCRQSLQDVGFVEEKGQLYCEDCYGRFLAPDCQKCRKKIIGNCLKAMSTTFHPECFACAYCNKIFANSPFYLEDGLPYCEEDWNELFTTKCISCGFPIEAGDRWVEALNNNYHSQCFNCSLCKKSLEGQSFFVKGGKPFCKSHARG